MLFCSNVNKAQIFWGDFVNTHIIINNSNVKIKMYIFLKVKSF